MSDRSIFTLSVHAGDDGQGDGRPVAPPLCSSVGYAYDSMEALDRVFSGEQQGYVYSRFGTPTIAAFERAVAALEGTKDAVAYASGMAAVLGSMMASLIDAQQRIVCAGDIYGATLTLARQGLAARGSDLALVDIANLDEVRQALAQPTAAVLCEVISNPLLKVADIAELAGVAHASGAKLIVDSTFSTPYLLRPSALGADYVLHSATKYVGGHGDALAGVVACSQESAQVLRTAQRLRGNIVGSPTAWLMLRGIKTLALRMREQCRNAGQIARAIEGHPRVAKVHYPGLTSHPQYGLATTQFGGRGYGGMVSIEIADAGRSEVFRFMEALKLVTPATTLGDVCSLVLYPAQASHRSLTAEERQALGIGDGLVRLSIGIEDAEDIIADVLQALERL